MSFLNKQFKSTASYCISLICNWWYQGELGFCCKKAEPCINIYGHVWLYKCVIKRITITNFSVLFQCKSSYLIICPLNIIISRSKIFTSVACWHQSYVALVKFHRTWLQNYWPKIYFTSRDENSKTLVTPTNHQISKEILLNCSEIPKRNIPLKIEGCTIWQILPKVNYEPLSWRKRTRWTLKFTTHIEFQSFTEFLCTSNILMVSTRNCRITHLRTRHIP